MDESAQSTGKNVLIVGAGPTGLVLALWLTRLGIGVRIIDKTSEPGTTSRALGVHARTLEFYRQLGFADEVVAHGIKTAGINLWVKGIKAARVPLLQMGEGQTAFPFLLIYPQDEHEKMLIRKLEEAGVHVERSTELLNFEQREGVVRASLMAPDRSQEIFEAAYLAGCDGANSTVRKTLTTQFPGGTYSHLFYVADVEASGPPTDNEVHVDLEDADFLAVFPLTRKGHVRVVGSIRDDMDGDREHLKFDDVRGKAMRSLKLEVAGENWFSTYRVHHRVAQHFRQGRVFLLGDAAHVHSPVGAQGMNTGIGDAVNLSWKLAAVLGGNAPETILDTFELERIAFARRLVGTTDRAFTLVTNRSGWAMGFRRIVVPFLLPRLVAITRFRRAMFRTLSQIAIRYRTSPLSLGSAGRVHAGDRLPWVRMPAGDDNHGTITGLEWSAHAYGDVQPGIPEACRELGLSLNRFPWQPGMRSSGFVRGGFYLLRPDGYVAMAEPGCKPRRLRDYFEQLGITAPGLQEGRPGQ
jgi:2-polyprenyl-6-methoxyphenol hydroxylase-like FAD-dependent oxidoreductase